VRCCPSPPLNSRVRTPQIPEVSPTTQAVSFAWCSLPGSFFRMGTPDPVRFPEDGEAPVRTVKVSSFAIAAYTVTNAQFGEFVRQTSYETDAERFNWSFVFAALVTEEVKRRVQRLPAETPWWLPIPHAYWAQPEGPRSTILDRIDHPVVHVSWNDACAYCQWSGTRLPTEAEWEFAARGGLDQAVFPWGNELVPDGEHRCNVWQGSFPFYNTMDDGYLGTAPVHAYRPNGYGLYNAAGNVWEWCADYFSREYHQQTATIDPLQSVPTAARSLRGGSFLCHESYCDRYKVAARSSNVPHTSCSNIGFRVVRSG
jgi:formylglycine-generating enzyme